MQFYSDSLIWRIVDVPIKCVCAAQLTQNCSMHTVKDKSDFNCSCMSFCVFATTMKLDPMLAVLLLLWSTVIAQEPHTVTPIIVPGNGTNTCPSTSQAIANLKRDVRAHLGDNLVLSHVFDSCNNVSAESPSGYYYTYEITSLEMVSYSTVI